ncbi:hypothetical protein FSW04_10990 [Baekduia soli]|uniref:Uncharacterized protein n=1 Tax=Baekduia soli TaxID=496014 RepID=A0A5B8U5W2_9ACTN|nr:hypothetical protein [Baekduia soli]QEC48042.1 hypothetical protein FSW04_10990 [Baekduia soli]
MPSTDAPNWWADVQQEREDLTGRGRRPAEDWLGEDIDFVPRRRISGSRGGTRRDHAASASHPLHGVFIPAADPRATGRTVSLTTGTTTIELVTEADMPVTRRDDGTDAGVAHELRHLSAADDPFASPPPPAGARRTVQIKGRPGEGAVRSLAQRHRPRTASDRVGHRPDRIALWAVVLGAILILLAAASSSRAAVPHRAATPHVAIAHVGAPAAFAAPHSIR